MGKRGFTILEVLISAVILALVTLGLVNVFVVAKRYMAHSRSRTAGGQIGKLFLDPLQMAVRQDTWGANSLSQGVSYCDSVVGHAQNASCPPGAAERQINGVTYDAKYDISFNTPIPGLTKVKLFISWNEPRSSL
ncbi:MAG: prepilin-type N-terminal cleavage/methylation domain-containing protein [Candidatus Omnitrophica bacterium]|nr:prepilin-type N-terminal cleavage/methylation domain-containing protein [Candidatus Omnitrophota bacterium]